MFCPECGKSNPDKLKNCQYCNAELIDNSNNYWLKFISIIKNKFLLYFTGTIFPYIKKFKIAIISIVAMSIMSIVFFSILSSLNSPEKFVNEYIESLDNSDYAAAFDMLDLPDNPFLTFAQFTNYCKSPEVGFSQMKAYSIIDLNDKNTDKNVLTYKIQYKHAPILDSTEYDNDTGISYGRLYSSEELKDVEKTIIVKLIKQPEKSWLFLSDYKIATDQMFGSYSITTYNDSTTEIDGISINDMDTLSTYTIPEYGDKITTYMIPQLFIGSHNLSVTHELCNYYETSFTVSKDYEGETDVTSSLTIKEEVTQSLAKNTEDLLKKMTNSAILQQGFESLDIECTANEDYLSDIKDEYFNFASDIKYSDDLGLISIEFTDFEDISYQTTLNSDFTYECRLNFTYNYISKHQNWYEEEPQEHIGDNCDGNIYVTYAFENGKWVLYEFDRWSLYC